MSFDPEATVKATSARELARCLAFPDLLLALLLGTLAFVALHTLAPDQWFGYYALHLWLGVWWLAGLAFGGALLASRGPTLTRLVRLSRNRIFKNGAGAYGAIGFVVFCHLEWARIETQWESFLGNPSIGRAIRELFDFGLASFMNTIWAAAWPAFWHKVFEGRQFWMAMGLSWALFEAARAGVEHLPRRGGGTAMGGER